ncbi:MAG: NAD(P)-dependent oxidoreductase [Pseudooceanicola sp.]|nr:NAD(P)-dependent oxidoreductase [Pseudooceanicola sp.]
MSGPIAVLGANGVFARHLLPRLRAAGHEVVAIVRRPEAAGLAQALGCTVRIADIYNRPALTAALEGCGTGINIATSLPGPSGRGDFAANDRLRSEGTANWTGACRDAGVGRILQQGIAMVAATGRANWGDEETTFAGKPDSRLGHAVAAALAMETDIRDSDIDFAILRGGLFYGPGTGLDTTWLARAKEGTLVVPDDGTDYVSLIHVADMAAATARAVERFPSGQTLIVCDDCPVIWNDLFAHIAALAGQPPPPTGAPLGYPSFRLSNARARAALDWAPFYPSYREGFAR